MVIHTSNYIHENNNYSSKTPCGTIVILNGGPILWLSCKQPCNATSTAKSKYIATSFAAKETIWVCCLFNDIGYLQKKSHSFIFRQPISYLFGLNPEFYKRTKHIDIVYHLICEFQDKEEIVISYVPTKLQLANILTKSLTPDVFRIL